MIQINLLRISSDSKYLEFSVECPVNYGFNTLMIKKYDSVDYVDLSSIFTEKKNKYVVRIPLELIGGSSMYYVQLKVEYIGALPAPEDECDSSLEAMGVCSDVSNIYKYLLTELLNLTAGCCVPEIPVDIQRLFTIMYSHIEAMRLEQFPEAEQFYSVLATNFTSCQTPIRNQTVKPCNCRTNG